MFRKFILCFLACTLFCCAYAQDKIKIQLFGKDKGSVEMLREGGQDYVAALPMAKKLKMRTSWFGKSGQLNITNGSGYFGVIREGQPFVMVNGQEQKLSSAPILKGGTLYAPFDFFEYGSLPAALGYDIAFKDGKIVVGEYSADKPKAAPVIKDGPAKAAPATAENAVPAPSVLGEDIEILDDDFFEGPSIMAAAPKDEPQIKQGQPKTVIKPLVTSTAVVKASAKRGRKARIVIDAGHGGKDSGAYRGGVREKDINLKVAKQLAALLNKEKIFEVKLSRSDDTFIPLGTRAKIANEYKADIFVSIHANAAKRASANGFEVYFRSDRASDAEAAETAALENEALHYEDRGGVGVSFADLLLKSLAVNEYMNESSKLASHIRNAVTADKKDIGIKVFENRSVKQANFYVLKGVETPSVLVEMGYLSNSADRKKLNSSSTQKKMAAAIKDGIVSYAKAEGWK